MEEIRHFLRDILASIFGMNNIVYALTEPRYETGIGIALAIFIGLWVYTKGRGFLISIGISFLICPLVALVIQFFMRENKRQAEENLNKGLAYFIMRFLFGG